MSEPFFSRWSKRKQAVAKGLPADEAAPGADHPPTPAAADAEPAAGPSADTPAEPLPTLQDVKDAGYTTTLKLMQIMHEKGLVGRDDSGKTHIYYALVSKEKTQQHLLGKMMQTLFDGSPAQLVMQALGGQKPSPEEIEKIEALLKQLK